jgi:hypothetical protein
MPPSPARVSGTTGLESVARAAASKRVEVLGDFLVESSPGMRSAEREQHPQTCCDQQAKPNGHEAFGSVILHVRKVVSSFGHSAVMRT